MFTRLKEIILKEIFSALARVVNSSGGKTHVFGPLIYFTGIWVLGFIIMLLCLNLISEMELKSKILNIYIGIYVMGFSVYLLIYFKSPELLQTEWYRIEDKKLDMISEKSADIQINPVDLTTPPQLTEGGQND